MEFNNIVCLFLIKKSFQIPDYYRDKNILVTSIFLLSLCTDTFNESLCISVKFGIGSKQ